MLKYTHNFFCVMKYIQIIKYSTPASFKPERSSDEKKGGGGYLGMVDGRIVGWKVDERTI